MPHRKVLVFLLLTGMILSACRNGDVGTSTITAESFIDINGISQLQYDLSGLEESPSWSPDDRYVVFSWTKFQLPSPNPYDAEIILFDLKTNQLKQITNNDAADREPDWSPVDNQIVFEREILWGQFTYQLVILNIDSGEERVFFECPVQCTWPAWSPDGEQIAFLMDGLSIINADGSDFREIELEKFFLINSPTWSPDGDKLAFLATTEPFEPGASKAPDTFLGVYDLLTGEETILLQTNLSGPEWSPDGTKILYSEQQAKSGEWLPRTLVEYDFTYKSKTPVITETLDEDIFDATWSTDGNKIAFAYGNILRYSHLFILDLRKYSSGDHQSP